LFRLKRLAGWAEIETGDIGGEHSIAEHFMAHAGLPLGR
jgi:hypothetical protein